MAREWPMLTISEISSRMAMGPFGSNIKTNNFRPSGVPVIRGVNLSDGRFNTSDFVYLSEEKADALRNSNAFPGDLVFTHRGTLGQVGIVPKSPFVRYVVSQSQMVLTCDAEKVDPIFLYYFFKSPTGQHALLMHTSQTGVPAISQPLTSLKSILVPVPPLPIQRRIAHILGTLDDKIELNRQMNRTLEKMAAAIFKSWFIDFDPVHAKAEVRDTGLPDDITDLFPDAFEESDLGLIPRGWTTALLKDMADVNAKSIKKDYLYARIQYVDISSVSQGSLDQTTTYDLADAPSRAKRLVQTGDIIWSCVRPNRKAYLYIDRPADNLVVSTGFAVLSPLAVPAIYLYQWVTTQSFVDYLTTYATGAAYPAVKADTFETAKMLQPAEGVLKVFHDIVGPLRDRVGHNQRQNLRLAGLRDALLPELISGEIILPEAEAVDEEVKA